MSSQRNGTIVILFCHRTHATFDEQLGLKTRSYVFNFVIRVNFDIICDFSALALKSPLFGFQLSSSLGKREESRDF
jgi:hypothetical protein